jgi:hypothetical protein
MFMKGVPMDKNLRNESTSDPQTHVENVQRMMNDLVQHIQEKE